MKLKLLFISFFTLVFFNLRASTTVPAIINSNQVWDVSGSPYLVGVNVLITQGVKVDVKPGVSIISNGLCRLTVNGTFSAMGKSDSLILIKGLSIYFSDSSVDYNPSSNTGSQFTYCLFKPIYKSSSSVITLDRTNLNIDYCDFDSISYPIQGFGSGDSVKLWISNSTFQGDGFGFLIYGLRQNSFISFTHNAVFNFGYILLAETNIIQYCYFYGMRYYASINDYGYARSALISCNYFKNGNYTYCPAIDLSTVNSTSRHIVIQNNEFDSMEVFIKMPCYYVATDTVEVNNNDFLHYRNKAVSYSGCSSTTGIFHVVDFTNNYWNTTDTTLIKAAIYDYRNDIKIPFKIDFSNFKSSPVSSCWPLSAVDAPKKVNTGITTTRKNATHFAIFPNPALTILNIETDLQGKLVCTIKDITSREVAHQEMDADHSSINVSNLKPGIYSVILLNEDGEQYILKLIHN